jgi:hypothetical protein
MSRRLDWIVGITLSAAAAAAGASGADGEWLEVPASGFAAVARDLAPGAQVRLSGLHDPDAARSETFVGRRFEIFAPDARLVARDANAERDLARPHDARFRGAFEGVAGSRVLISVLADGTLRGIAADWTGFSLILPGADGAPQVRRVDAARRPARPFRCDQAELAGAAVPPVDFDAALRAAPPAGTFAGLAPAPSYTARVAIDSDFEFYNLFGDTIDAVEYVADLMAFMSILYEEEVDTSMQVSYLRLWTTAVDPWNQSSSICNLFDFGKYWNDNMTGQSRTIAHMMSGKNSGGGVAWRGVLCNGPFNYDTTGSGCSFTGVGNYGGAYGYTGAMDGDFTYENPTVVWDLMATSHEIGHNFSSKHTHCYAGIGGNPSQVDRCYVNEQSAGDSCNPTTQNWNVSGCACNPGSSPATLPGPGSTTGGSPGQANGTVMSYCHLLGGVTANVSYTMGMGHPWGVAPDRVPAAMLSHVVARAASYPTCLPFVPGSSVLFRHGFENASTTGWSAAVP